VATPPCEPDAEPAREVVSALRELKPTVDRGRQVALAALAMTMVLLALTLLKVVTAVTSNTQRVQTAQQAAIANRESIYVACTLLANAIAQTGTVVESNSNERPSARQQLNALYISAILSRMTPAERAEERRLRKQTSGRLLEIPDCLQIARHPETVRAEVP
jgi:ABC-type anion transport system duplicated permease subunit